MKAIQTYWSRLPYHNIWSWIGSILLVAMSLSLDIRSWALDLLHYLYEVLLWQMIRSWAPRSSAAAIFSVWLSSPGSSLRWDIYAVVAFLHLTKLAGRADYWGDGDVVALDDPIDLWGWHLHHFCAIWALLCVQSLSGRRELCELGLSLRVNATAVRLKLVRRKI